MSAAPAAIPSKRRFEGIVFGIVVDVLSSSSAMYNNVQFNNEDEQQHRGDIRTELRFMPITACIFTIELRVDTMLKLVVEGVRVESRKFHSYLLCNMRTPSQLPICFLRCMSYLSFVIFHQMAGSQILISHAGRRKLPKQHATRGLDGLSAATYYLGHIKFWTERIVAIAAGILVVVIFQ